MTARARLGSLKKVDFKLMETVALHQGQFHAWLKDHVVCVFGFHHHGKIENSHARETHTQQNSTMLPSHTHATGMPFLALKHVQH